VSDGPGPVWESHMWCVGGSVTGAAWHGGEGAIAHGWGMGEATEGSEGLRISAVRLKSLDLVRGVEAYSGRRCSNLLQGPSRGILNFDNPGSVECSMFLVSESAAAWPAGFGSFGRLTCLFVPRATWARFGNWSTGR
jgi:hypothetical protein